MQTFGDGSVVELFVFFHAQDVSLQGGEVLAYDLLGKTLLFVLCESIVSDESVGLVFLDVFIECDFGGMCGSLAYVVHTEVSEGGDGHGFDLRVVVELVGIGPEPYERILQRIFHIVGSVEPPGCSSAELVSKGCECRCEDGLAHGFIYRGGSSGWGPRLESNCFVSFVMFGTFVFVRVYVYKRKKDCFVTGKKDFFLKFVSKVDFF